MLGFRKRLLLFVLLIVSFGAESSIFSHQQDTSKATVLEEVKIKDKYIKNLTVGHKTYVVDTLSLQLANSSNLTSMLGNLGYGNLRSYGLGGVATASFRGTVASHTAILWNGINLQNSLSGLQDLSLVPVSFVDNIQLQMGGSASLYGSGAMGGIIHLDNKSTFSRGLSLRTFQGIGSFGKYYQDYSVEWSGAKFISKTKFFCNKATNDFPYTNNYKFPSVEERRERSTVNQYGVLQQNYWKVNNQNIVGINLWYQDNNVEVPNPISVPKKTEAKQKDEFYRVLLNWKHTGSFFDLSYKSFYTNHDLDFSDLSDSVNSSNYFLSTINKIDLNVPLKNHFDITFGLNHTYEKAIVDDFGSQEPTRNRIVTKGALRYESKNEKIISAVSVIKEFINGSSNPLGASLGFQFQLSALKFFGNTSRNYRIPTFNDLYWRGNYAKGNPNLSSETSWNQEIGVSYHKKLDLKGQKVQFNSSITGFNIDVDNWILWAEDEQSIWSPENIKRVWSRGLELDLSVSTSFRSVYFNLQGMYTFSKVTNREIKESQNSNEIGKQLIYTPLHQAGGRLRIAWKKMRLLTSYNFTGKQYTDGSNSEVTAIKPFHVVNFFLTRSIRIQRFSGRIQFEINNIFNERYERRRAYPMPGRNYQLGLNIEFNKS